MKRYFKIWLRFTTYSFITAIDKKLSLSLFFLGKVLRIGLFLVFILFILGKTKTLGGYNNYQVLLFLLTYNFLDTVSQLLFREVYRFRGYIVEGSFDLVLSKPYPPLLKVLLGGTDILDLIILPPLIMGIIYIFHLLHLTSFSNIVFYFLFCVNSLIISASLHILVLSLGVVTTEIDNTIMLYRDITRMGTIPIDLYRQPLQFILTFILPVGLMIAFPAKFVMGLLTWYLILYSFLFGAFFLWLSLKIWHISLKNYSSASS